MALRKCASCGGDLAAGSTARAKFCSATCRKRASRAGADSPTLSIVPPAPPEDKSPPLISRIEALESAAARLNRLLDESDPRSAANLNKEYRETLRELDTLREAAAPKGGHERTDGARRPFDAAAV